MVKETIAYVDFDGNKREEEHYFHLSKTELREMELSESGGMSAKMDRIIKAQNVPELYKAFKEIILAAYGIKSLDGKRFEKSAQITTEFTQTNAYDVFMDKICTDADAAATFMNKLVESAA